jgi:HK97 gp10 family phage protein
MVAKMTVEGREALARKIRALSDKVRVPVQNAVVQGAEDIADTQRTFVPVDEGDLKASIHVTKPGETTPAHSQPGGSRVAREYEAIVTAGNDRVRYPHLVEFGTKPHPQGGMFEGTEHPGTPAQPYFWPGYRLVRKRVRSRVKRIIGKAIKTEFSR